MREIAYYEAKFEALHEIMAADPTVHLMNGTFLSLESAPSRLPRVGQEIRGPDHVAANI